MNSLIRLDNKITFALQRWPAALHPYMLAITQLGSVGVVMLASLVIAIVAYSKHRMRLAVAFAAVLPAEVFNAGLKVLFDRARPSTQYAADMFLHTKSFPSGHAFGSLVFYGLLAYLAATRLPHGWNIIVPIGLAVLVVLIGISRVYLGAHYSLDVLGGWIVGAIILVLIIKFTKI